MTAAESMERAIGRLAQKDFAAREARGARVAYEKLSEADKHLALAAANVADAKAKQAAETEKAAKAAEKAASKSTVSSWTELKSKIDLVTGAVSAAADAFEKVMELGKAGAVVNQTTASFDGLIDNLGTSSDLLEQLRKASRNTVDDMTLMSSTTTLLAGVQGELGKELAGATPQLLEIAKAANKLNPTLGDTTYMYESLALGIKRGSPMILDNLGLTIRVGEANEEFAKKIGKTAEQLTAEEQKQALLNATLKAGQVLIQQAGGKADSATDSFARLDTATKNLSDTIKADLAPSIATAAESMTEYLLKNQEINAAIEEGYGKIGGLGGAIDAYTLSQYRAAEGERIMRDAMYESQRALQEQRGALEESRGVYAGNEETIRRSAELTDAMAESYEGAGRAAVAAAGHAQAMAAASSSLADAQTKLSEAEASWKSGEGGDVARMLDERKMSASQYEAGLAAIDAAMGTNLRTDYQLTTAQEDLAKKFADGKITAGEFSKGLEKLNDKFLPMNESIMKATDLVTKLQQRVNDLSNRTYNVVVRAVVSGDIAGSVTTAVANAGTSVTTTATSKTKTNNKPGVKKEAGGGAVFPGTTVMMNESPATGTGRPEVFVSSGGGHVLTRQQAQQAVGSGMTQISIGELVLNGVQNVQDLLYELGAMANLAAKSGMYTAGLR